MAVDKKFFVDINLQGNALNNATIGSNSDMTKGGSFRFDGERLEYFDGTQVEQVANLSDISAVTGGLILQGGYDAATNTPDIANGAAEKGFFWVVTAAGNFLGDSVQVGDSIIAKVDNAGASIGDWLILQGNVVIASETVDGIVRLGTQAEVNAGTEGGAVVLTPATFENSSQLANVRGDITNLQNDKLNLLGGTMQGDIDMNGNSITNLPAPTNGNDAANKTYVDDQAAAAQTAANAYTDSGLALKLNLSGGTMSGAINMNGNDISDVNRIDTNQIGTPDNTDILSNNSLDLDGNSVKNLAAPTNGGDAANKTYVDDQATAAETAANSYTDSGLSQKLSLSGGTMTGNIDMNSYDINGANSLNVNSVYAITVNTGSINMEGGTVANVPTPTADTDAANKIYVDTAASTAQSNAESYADSLASNYDAAGSAAQALTDANSYTDTELNASRYTGQAGVLDWTLVGGVYTQTITHNLSSVYPVVQLFDQNNKACELGVDVIDAQSILLTSNIQLGGNIYLTVLKGGLL